VTLAIAILISLVISLTTTPMMCARLRPKMAQVTGVQAFLQAVQDIGGAGGGRSANAEYQYTLLGDDLTELRDWSAKLRKALQDVPEVTDVDTDMQPGRPRDRPDRRSRCGLAPRADRGADRQHARRCLRAGAGVDHLQPLQPAAIPRRHGGRARVLAAPRRARQALRQHRRRVGQRHAGHASRGRHDQTQIERRRHHGERCRPGHARNAASNSLANAGRGNTSTGSAVSVARESVVPFSAFSHFATGTTPVSVNHTGTSASTSIAFNLPENESLSTALAAIDRTMNQIHVPATIRGGSYGTARLFQQNTSSEPLLLLAAFAAIYVVLGILYESYSHPLTILSTLPSAGWARCWRCWRPAMNSA
jgi:multidrug efflux pump